MQTTAAPPRARPRTGLALACLVLGVLAVLGSLLVVGALLGVVAVVLGAVHIVSRRGPNGLAWGGIALGFLSIILSGGLALAYVKLGTMAGRPLVEVVRNAIEGIQSRAPVEHTAVAPLEAWVGVEVPDFTVTSLEGETFRASELRGRRVVLNFWGTWCPPCRMEVPHFIRLAGEHPREQLLILALSDEGEDTLRAFVERENINYPVASADGLPAPFDALAAVPTTFFIDRRGIIQDVTVGYKDYDALKRRALAADFRGKPKPAPGAESETYDDAEETSD